MKTQPVPTILFVERDRSVLWMYQELFEGSGELFFTESVSEAKEALADRKFDLLVSCYRLSDGNGLDLLKYIRSKKMLMPFVLCTGKDSSELPSVRDEKFFVVKKPGSGELREIVAQCLGRFKRRNKPAWPPQGRKKILPSDNSLEMRLLKIPLCKMFEALDAIDDLDKLILEKMEHEGTSEQLEKCHVEVAERRRNRWEFICYRMIQDAQAHHLEIKRAGPFDKGLSQIS